MYLIFIVETIASFKSMKLIIIEIDKLKLNYR